MLKFVLVSLFIFSSFTTQAQTHTNRGGKGPDIENPKSCSVFILSTVKDLQLKYIKSYLSKKVTRNLDQREKIEMVFKDLIQKKALDLDLSLVGEYKAPTCKSCLSDQKQILLEIIELYERHKICPEFWKKEDEIKWIKNIIIYGK